MGPYGDDMELPDVDGVDNAPDQAVRRRMFEDLGWRIWKDSHDVWHAEGDGASVTGKTPGLRFLLDELARRSTEFN